MNSSLPFVAVEKTSVQDGCIVANVRGTISGEAIAGNEIPEHELKDVSFLILDLSQAIEIDSAGVSWLVHLNQLCQQNGGCLTVHSVPPTVQRTLKLLNIPAVFPVVDTEAQAQEAVQQRRGVDSS